MVVSILRKKNLVPIEDNDNNSYYIINQSVCLSQIKTVFHDERRG